MPTALDVRETRPDAKAKLRKLADIVEQIASTTTVADRLMARRLAHWKALRALDPPVSWADIARVSGVDSVTVIQAVQGRKPR